MGSDNQCRWARVTHNPFQSTLPAWGATLSLSSLYSAVSFQSTLPAWGATCPISLTAEHSAFQSTLPAWGATTAGVYGTETMTTFQSTLPAWGATARPARPCALRQVISIHAPRMGSDGTSATACMGGIQDFNPRSPHGERLNSLYGMTATDPDFNPRSPHGERHSPPRKWRVERYFNPRSPHGERQQGYPVPSWRTGISIHAPRMGSDARTCGSTRRHTSFQSTLPAWGATTRRPQRRRNQPNFNPRSPHGERPDGK